MATSAPYNEVSYGLSQSLINVFPSPVPSKRAPGTADKARIGTVWCNTATNTFYILTSIVANSATWVSAGGGGSGVFASVEATSGNITADAGNIVATAGTATIHGTITSSTGNLVSTAGSVSAATTVTAGTGITATTGNIVASTGSVNVTAGNITVTAGNITATVGEIVAGGLMECSTLTATGDLGGTALSTSITGVVDATQSTGTLSIKSTTGNDGNNTGFLKCYVGTTAVYVPYFATINP